MPPAALQPGGGGSGAAGARWASGARAVQGQRREEVNGQTCLAVHEEGDGDVGEEEDEIQVVQGGVHGKVWPAGGTRWRRRPMKCGWGAPAGQRARLRSKKLCIQLRRQDTR